MNFPNITETIRYLFPVCTSYFLPKIWSHCISKNWFFSLEFKKIHVNGATLYASFIFQKQEAFVSQHFLLNVFCIITHSSSKLIFAAVECFILGIFYSLSDFHWETFWFSLVLLTTLLWTFLYLFPSIKVALSTFCYLIFLCSPSYPT